MLFEDDGCGRKAGIPAPEQRIASLRTETDAAIRSDLDRAVEGLASRVATVESAKDAFDRAIGTRLDREGRHWTGIAQAAYAAALDLADAAGGGAPFLVTHALPAKPVFQAAAGDGMISLHPGEGDRHRVEFRLAPSLEPSATATVEWRLGRGCILTDDGGSLLLSAARAAIEEAVAALLADPWRVALSELVDRCVETSLYANIVVRRRLEADREGAAEALRALPLLRG